MQVVKFTETLFSEKNKKNIITPDKDGYYEVIVGALNCYNSASEYYVADGVVQMFESSSHFMRRIKNGCLYSEVGHPSKLPGMSLESFYTRVVTIDEKNVCGHFSEVTLDFEYGKKFPELKNPDMIAIIAKVKPAGPKANTLQSALENPKQNCCFSIRGLTENKYKNNRVERRLTNIITFDNVIEPGISIANKTTSPSLESKFAYENFISEISDTLVDKTILKKVLTSNIDNISFESSRQLFNEILNSIERQNSRNNIGNW